MKRFLLGSTVILAVLSTFQLARGKAVRTTPLPVRIIQIKDSTQTKIVNK